MLLYCHKITVNIHKNVLWQLYAVNVYPIPKCMCSCPVCYSLFWYICLSIILMLGFYAQLKYKSLEKKVYYHDYFIKKNKSLQFRCKKDSSYFIRRSFTIKLQQRCHWIPKFPLKTRIHFLRVSLYFKS